MSLFNRVTNWFKDKDIQPSDLNAEFNGLVNTLNNLDQATFAWTNVKATNLSFTTLTIAANQAMSGFKLTGLGAGTGAGDSLRYEQVIGLYLLLTGGTMSGNIAMGTNKLTGLGAGTGTGDSLRYEQLIGLYLLLAGGTMAGPIAMGGNKVTGLGAGTVSGDALRYEQVIGLYLLLTGGTMSGNIAMGSNKLTGLAAGSGAGDSLRYEQLIGLYLLLTGGTMSGAIAMGTNKITGLGNGTAAQDAAAYGQLHLLQSPIQATNTTTTSTVSTTFVNTSLAATITPTSTSSKILIMASGCLTANAVSIGGSSYASLDRSGTNIGGANGLTQATSQVSSASTDDIYPCAFHYIDSPATTSSVTYTVTIRSNAGTLTTRWNQNNITATIQLFEVV